MKIPVIVFLCAIAFVPRPAAAADAVEEKVVGAAIKGIARSYIATTDIEKLKIANISRLEATDFRLVGLKYASMYDLIADLPESFKARYRIDEFSDKRELIERIGALDRATLASMVSDIPDRVLTEHFKRYVSRRLDELRHKNIQEKIKIAWKRFLQRFGAGGVAEGQLPPEPGPFKD